jgi:hypothetical protein
LFSASSVIESRASTDLGENVKLLTYVSIFYLPLGFSAALWSINRDCGVTPFVIVTVLVASITYILVANLGNVVLAIKSSYKAIREPILKRMGGDHDTAWIKNGNRFKQFRPDRANVMPSQWLVLQFLLVSTLRKLGFFHAKPRSERRQDPGTDSVVERGGEERNAEDKQQGAGAEVDEVNGGDDIAIQGEEEFLFTTTTLTKHSPRRWICTGGA